VSDKAKHVSLVSRCVFVVVVVVVVVVGVVVAVSMPMSVSALVVNVLWWRLCWWLSLMRSRSHRLTLMSAWALDGATSAFFPAGADAGPDAMHATTVSVSSPSDAVLVFTAFLCTLRPDVTLTRTAFLFSHVRGTAV
jgi:hypothetical protein